MTWQWKTIQELHSAQKYAVNEKGVPLKHEAKASTGAIAAGASLMEATQKSNTFTAGIGLIRAVPGENWLDPRNRTTVDFTTSYVKLTQPNTPSVKTSNLPPRP